MNPTLVANALQGFSHHLSAGFIDLNPAPRVFCYKMWHNRSLCIMHRERKKSADKYHIIECPNIFAVVQKCDIITKIKKSLPIRNKYGYIAKIKWSVKQALNIIPWGSILPTFCTYVCFLSGVVLINLTGIVMRIISTWPPYWILWYVYIFVYMFMHLYLLSTK